MTDEAIAQDREVEVVATITDNVVIFNLCQDKETGALFLAAADTRQNTGTVLFAKAETLREFARGIIKACQRIN